MVDVICDTSFLIHLANNRIINIDRLDADIGQISFVVPYTVKTELDRLNRDPDKQARVRTTLEYIKNLKVVPIDGEFADKALLDYSSKHKAIVATMDRGLKKLLKENNCSIISFSRNHIVLE